MDGGITRELAPWLGPAAGALPEGAARRVMNELWTLLSEKAAVLSRGDSSIRAEEAQELLRSLCFVVSQALEPLPADGAARLLLDKPLAALYRAGFQRLVRRIFHAKAAYDRALREALPFENLAYRDTLQSIGGFFHAYRPDLFAHDIPAMIDYPLFRPAEGSGVRYIESYLWEWRLENAFLARLPFDRVVRLHGRHFRDAREQVVNLFEPAAANALGLLMLGKDPAALHVSPEDGARLFARARRLGERSFAAALRRAADGLAEGDGRALLRALAADVAARVSALPPEGMAGVFTAL